MVLLEKGIDHKLTEIDLDDKPDWFLRISPYGKVPVIRHNEDVIFESAVINEYLEEIFPDIPLLPDDPVERAQARIWIDFANVRFVPHIYKMLLAQNEDAQIHHKDKLTEALTMIEREVFENGPGSSFWLGRSYRPGRPYIFPTHATLLRA